MKKRNIWIISIAIIILLLLFGVGFYLYEEFVNTGTIYEGVFIGEYPVGGMTEQEAAKYIREKKSGELSEKFMTLNYDDRDYKVILSELGFDYNYDEAAKWAFTKARTGGGPLSRYGEIKSLKKENWEVSLKLQPKESKIKDEVNKIAEDLDREPVDAIISFEDGNFSISEDKFGLRVLKDELIKAIEDNRELLNDINIPMEEVKPKYTKEYYSKINGVLGEYSTSFAGSASGRIENIRVSARAFNNLLIHPGQDVSYNETTGPKDYANGYREAPVILKGELVPGLGGGICQTSTTLYNTLLLADLDIVERSPHSLPPSYVNLGRDAAVSQGVLDLKFKNNFDYPIYLTSKIVGTRVYFYVYGDAASRDYTVRISQEIVDFKPMTTKEILDTSMEAGSVEVEQEGRNGYKSKTYKTIIKDGQVISSKQINSDYYRERQHIVRHGVKISENLQPENPENPEKPENPENPEKPKEPGEEKPVESEKPLESEKPVEKEEIVDEIISLDPVEEKLEP